MGQNEGKPTHTSIKQPFWPSLDWASLRPSSQWASLRIEADVRSRSMLFVALIALRLVQNKQYFMTEHADRLFFYRTEFSRYKITVTDLPYPYPYTHTRTHIFLLACSTPAAHPPAPGFSRSKLQ